MGELNDFIESHDKVHDGIGDKLDCIIEKIDNLNEIELTNGGGITVKYDRGEYFQKIHTTMQKVVDCDQVNKIVDKKVMTKEKVVEIVDEAPARWRKKSALFAADWTKIFLFIALLINALVAWALYFNKGG